MTIKKLSQKTINRIAAGEVIERPASVVKELVENAIDAGAKNISVVISDGGKSAVIVQDDGCGMDANDLELCIEAHATSKLDENDIMNIVSLGFRGEALPSIGSVAKMSISSKTAAQEVGNQLTIIAGEKQPLKPVAMNVGTKIEVRDLFYPTPARLKFLKNNSAEQRQISDIIKKLALSNPNINFRLSNDTKTLLDFKTELTDNALQARVIQVFGKDYLDNASELKLENANIKIYGYVSIPTFYKSMPVDQYFFVNNRPVKDKIIITALKLAYQDYLVRDKHPVVAIFIEIDSSLLDVNVHPTKAEVRFINPAEIRSLLISAIKNALAVKSQDTSTLIAEKTIAHMQPRQFETASNEPSNLSERFSYYDQLGHQPKKQQDQEVLVQEKLKSDFAPAFRDFSDITVRSDTNNKITDNKPYEEHPLGAAVCQLHKTYIISQNADSIIITDQHAAHERLVYEKMKLAFQNKQINTQRILIPELIELEAESLELLLSKKQELHDFGISFEQCADNAIFLRETPSLIGNVNGKDLIYSIISTINEFGENLALVEQFEHILETIACHNSIRAGRKLNIQEMNAILRDMEGTPFSGQCNHGRPTYVKLNLKDIEKLFGRI